MKCIHCGADNPAESKFCYKCGASLIEEQSPPDTETQEPPQTDRQPSSPKGTPQEDNTLTNLAKEGLAQIQDTVQGHHNKLNAFLESDAVVINDTVCPYCNSSKCHPIQKSTTSIKQTGYNLSSGCCGMCLLGPFGLLCGLLGTGSKVNIENETWWTCMQCGKEHISQKSAIEKGEAMINSSFMFSFIGGILFAIAFWGYGLISITSLILIAVAFGLPISIWRSIFDTLNKELGYSIVTILTPEQKKGYFNKFIACMALVILVGIFLPLLLELLAGE